MHENTKLGLIGVGVSVLASFAALGQFENSLHEADPHKKFLQRESARGWDHISTIGTLAAFYNFYKAGYKKSTVVVGLGWLAFAAYGSRKGLSFAMKDLAVKPKPAVAGYFPHGPSVIPSYPATPFAADPLYTQYPQW